METGSLKQEVLRKKINEDELIVYADLAMGSESLVVLRRHANGETELISKNDLLPSKEWLTNEYEEGYASGKSIRIAKMAEKMKDGVFFKYEPPDPIRQNVDKLRKRMDKMRAS